MSENQARNEEVQLVVFSAGGVEFGISISVVSEIIQETGVTKLPGMPSFVLGVLNLRNKVIPIVDLGERLGMYAPVENEGRGRILFVEFDNKSIGFLVTEVSEVISVSKDLFDANPAAITGTMEQGVVDSICKLGDRLIPILKIEHLLGQDELEAVGEVDTWAN